MATAQKRKPSAKRAPKTAAKSSYSAATRSARPASASSSWAKQSATLLPFAQGDMGEASKQAAEKMMKMGSDAMQQFWSQAQDAAKHPESIMEKMKAQANDVFGNAMPKMPKMPDMMAGFAGMMPKMPEMPNFDPAEMQEKMTKFCSEAAEQFQRSAGGSSKATQETMELSRENAEAMVEVMNLAMAMMKEMGAEAISCANKVFSRNVELSKEAFTCRTLNDMFDLAGRATKANLDIFFSQSVKFSEMAFQMATEVSEPLNERVSESAERFSKAMVA